MILLEMNIERCTKVMNHVVLFYHCKKIEVIGLW